jgi:hypothetical protein
MEDETKSAQMNQLTATFLIGAVGMFILTLFLVKKLDKE